VEKGDILTLIGGFVCVLIVAVIANPHALAGLPIPVTQATNPTQTPAPATTLIPIIMNTMPETNETTLSTTLIPSLRPTFAPPDPPYRITYIQNPFIYPNVRLPDHMESFGASDIGLRESPAITFAYIEEARGGVTQNFTVPYEIWAFNISVTANRQPQYARFRMVLCDMKTGQVIEGAEIQNPGTMYKVIQSSNRPMYIIVSTQYVDSFRIEFETPQKYYEKTRTPAIS